MLISERNVCQWTSHFVKEEGAWQSDLVHGEVWKQIDWHERYVWRKEVTRAPYDGIWWTRYWFVGLCALHEDLVCIFLSFSDYFYKLFSVYNILNEGGLQMCCSPWNENLTLLVQIKFLNLFLYVSKKTNWKIYWSEQSFTGLKAEDQCSSWRLVLVGKTVS